MRIWHEALGERVMFRDRIYRSTVLEGASAEGETKPRGKLKIGLALGGGAARGWAHIGVMRVLTAAGIEPDVIAGSSIGAVVGGCYAAGKLDNLEAFARSLTKRRVMGLMDFHIGSGLIGGTRLQRLLEQDLDAERVETLPIRFCTIATELTTGHEVWLTRGPLVQAMRASYALPGVFDAVRIGKRWLMDGALVNPIPITAARALGADLVICVNLNGEARARGTVIQSYDSESADQQDIEQAIVEPRRWGFLPGSRPPKPPKPDAPGLATVMVEAFNITQDRIARSRLAGDPPDAMISPKLAKMGLFDFHRANEFIDFGHQAAERALPDIMELIAESEQA
jgi:NTE family protein